MVFYGVIIVVVMVVGCDQTDEILRVIRIGVVEWYR